MNSPFKFLNTLRVGRHDCLSIHLFYSAAFLAPTLSARCTTPDCRFRALACASALKTQNHLKTCIESLDSMSPLSSCTYKHLRIVSNCELHHLSRARLQLRLWDSMQMSWCHLCTSDSGFKSALCDRNMQLWTIGSNSCRLGLLRLTFTSSCKSRLGSKLMWVVVVEVCDCPPKTHNSFFCKVDLHDSTDST